jgi:hypothetical protein
MRHLPGDIPAPAEFVERTGDIFVKLLIRQPPGAAKEVNRVNYPVQVRRESHYVTGQAGRRLRDGVLLFLLRHEDSHRAIGQVIGLDSEDVTSVQDFIHAFEGQFFSMDFDTGLGINTQDVSLDDLSLIFAQGIAEAAYLPVGVGLGVPVRINQDEMTHPAACQNDGNDGADPAGCLTLSCSFSDKMP